MQEEILTDEQIIQQTRLIKGFQNLAGYCVSPTGNVYSLATQAWLKPYYPCGQRCYYYIRDTSYSAARLVAYAYLGKPENFDPTKQNLLDYDVKFKNEVVTDIRPDNLYWEHSRSIRGLHRLAFNEDEIKTIKRHYVELFNSSYGYNEQQAIRIIRDQYYKKISPTTKSPSYFKKLISGQKPYHYFKDFIPHENLTIDTKVYVNNKKLKTYLQQGSIVEYDILKDRFLVVLDTGYSITIRAKNLSPIYTHDMNSTDEPYQENNYTEVTYTKNTHSTENEDYNEDNSTVQKIKKTFKDIFG